MPSYLTINHVNQCYNLFICIIIILSDILSMLKNLQRFIIVDVSHGRSKRDSMQNLLITLVLMACSFSILIVFPSLTYAQSSSSSSSSGSNNSNDNMKKQTSGGALDVVLQLSPQPVGHTDPTSLKVQFLTKGTSAVQPHIDYNLIIKDGNGKQVFSASQLAGQSGGAPLHTAEGIVTIPYTFQAPGDYTVNLTVYGILFNPIKPESADFIIKTK